MIIPNSWKHRILVKMDRLLREDIVDTYLVFGNNEIELINLSNRIKLILSTAVKIVNEIDVDADDLRAIENLFSEHRSAIPTVTENVNVEFGRII